MVAGEEVKDTVLGYYKDGTPILPTPRGSVVTRAFILCSQCRAVIKTTGGPAHSSLCVSCWEKYNERNN